MTGPLVITGSTSGQELFAVNGVNGRLFTVTDDLSNSLFSVNTVAGLPVIEAFANNTVNLGPFSAPIVINASGISTPSHGTSANWHSAYNDVIISAAVSGTTTKTLTLTQRDGGTVTASWTDIDTDTDTNTDQQTLSISGSTLTISGGNSVTIPSGGISQATADGLYVKLAGGSTVAGTTYFSGVESLNVYGIRGRFTDEYIHLYNKVGIGHPGGWGEGRANTANFGLSTYGPMNIAYGTSDTSTINGPLNIMGSSMYVTPSQLHIGAPGSGTAQLSFESWGSYTGAIAMSASGQFHWGGQGASSWYWKKDCVYDGDYTTSGTTLLSLSSDGNLTAAGTITAAGGNSSQWNTAHGWGNHASAGYLPSSSYTATDVLNKIKTVDGSGSGLDADLLDGYNSDTIANVNTIVRRDASGNIYSNYVLGTYFNASLGNSENPTIGQIWTQNTSDNYLRKSTPTHFRSQITDGYYLSLNGGTINGTLDLANNNLQGVGHIIMSDSGFGEGIQWENWFICDSPNDNSNQAGNLQFVYVPDNGVRMTFDTTGTLTLSDRLIELSSIRYKTQVESLTPALDKVLQLRPVHYVKIGGTGSTEIGLIAEEVAEIYPELIKYDDNGQVDGINYTRIAPILIKTIQEQQELIKNLTKRIDDLENR
jgi:hypothetical protein